MAWNQHESFQTAAQTGGVALLTVNKLTYRVASSGCDPSGLGQWTWTRFWGKMITILISLPVTIWLKMKRALSLSSTSNIDTSYNIMLTTALFNNT